MIAAKEGTTPEEIADRMEAPAGLPLSRVNDPETSHEAADKIVKDLPRLRRIALRTVQAFPGSTASELALENEDRDTRRIGRRLPELEKQGLIRRDLPRKCHVTGASAATWWPA